MTIVNKLRALSGAGRRALKRLVQGELLDDFLQRDKAAWEQAGYLHPEREGSMRGMMIFHTHCIEKGLTMPRFEPGHGGSRIEALCRTISEYRTAGYDQHAFEYRAALATLAEYQRVHMELGCPLTAPLARAIHECLKDEQVTPEKQIDLTPRELWQNTEAPFPVFSASRHSIRHLKGAAPRENILSAINLATNAPCACNKQYVRVHLYEGRDKVQPLLALQNGNAGFGDSAEQLLIVTSDMNYMHWRGERHEIYVCAGLFAMNLSYALHYHHVAHCMLNWQVTPESDRKMRTAAAIPEQEEIALLIVCGLPAPSFKVTASGRRNGAEMTTIH